MLFYMYIHKCNSSHEARAAPSGQSPVLGGFLIFYIHERLWINGTESESSYRREI